MSVFDPTSATLGGALIGAASVLMMLLLGRIAGVSGILAGCLGLTGQNRGWPLAFVAGLVAAPLIGRVLGFPISSPQMPASWVMIAAAGLLVGFGTRLGGGCTSGHGVCGIARMSKRSITATTIFTITAMIVVAIMRHGFRG